MTEIEGMIERITLRQFHQTDGVEDWRVLGEAEALVEALRTRRRVWQAGLAELSRRRLAELAAVRAQDGTRAVLSGL